MPQKKRKEELRESDAEEGRRAGRRERREEHAHDPENCRAADPRLDAEPATRDKRTHKRGHICANGAE